MKIVSIIFFLALLIPGVASAEQIVDVGFVNNGVYFSKQQFVVGEQIRAYARMRNFGDTDLVGLVGFYMGDQLLQEAQSISLPAGGVDEEVFIDFVVPEGAFNVAARINSTNPQDQNTSNNSVQTILVTPIHDNDLDGVENSVDNCKDKANSSQLDSDGDSIGDECDSDDDNDGLNDDVEVELGTNSVIQDSDDDGVDDAQDAQPLNPQSSTAEVVAPSHTGLPKPEPVAGDENVATKTTDDIESFFGGFFKFGTQQDAEPGSGDVQELSPDAIFTVTQKSWNTFVFETKQSDIIPVSIKWNFGDGEESDKASAEHIFSGAGTYRVMLQVTDDAGEVKEDSVDIVISFFHLSNPVFLAFVVVLVIICLLTVATMFRLKVETEEDDDYES